jgi:hypothetical protein
LEIRCATLIVLPEIHRPEYLYFTRLDSNGEMIKQLAECNQPCLTDDGPENLALKSQAKELEAIATMRICIPDYLCGDDEIK